MQLRNMLSGETYAHLLEGRHTERENRRLYAALTDIRFPHVNLNFLFEDDDFDTALDLDEDGSFAGLNVEETSEKGSSTGPLHTMTIRRRPEAWYRFTPSDAQYADRLPAHYYLFYFTGDPRSDDYTHSELRVFWMSDLPPEKLSEVLAELKAAVDLVAASRDVDV